MSFADIEAELNTATQAVFANCTATVDGAAVTDAVFDNNYVDAMGIESSGPALTISTAQVATATHDTPVVVNGAAYKVIEIKPDGTGITVLRLHKP